MIAPRHVCMMKEIAVLGGSNRFVKISTKELGLRMGISQQSASRWLNEMKTMGLVDTRRSGRDMYIRVSSAGMDVLKRERYGCWVIFGVPETIELTGTVITGLGEGKYYIMKKGYLGQIIEKIGFSPFPGTLNIKVNPAYHSQVRKMRSYDGILISGFTEGIRRYGNVRAYFCKVNGYPGAVVVPEMSHYTDVVEIIADVNLRKRIGLKDGDEVKVDILL